MYGQTEDQEKQKKKIILVSLVMGIIIIILIGVLISSIANKNRAKLASNGKQDTSVVKDDNTNKSDNTKSDSSDTKKSDSDTQKDASDSKLDPVANDKQNVTPKTEVKDNLPSTGAEDLFGLALLLGSATTFLLSKKLAFARA